MKGYKYGDRMYIGTDRKPENDSGSPVITAGEFINDPDGVYEFDEEIITYEDNEWGVRHIGRAIKPKV